MKPLRLEIEGFTSFREAVTLDFEGLDLFAITGPTGAGKSSLIDALVFALYGQVPRVGREYKQLISHGAERLSVKLDFEVGGRRYRLARTARLAGNPQTVLERDTGKGYEPLAGRVKEVEDAIQEIVGLDYEAFTRSVVLPQGQFDAFLKGEPKERHKILIALLNLDLYVEMQKIAHRRASDAKREAEFIASQLGTDFKDATADRLEGLRQALARAQAERDRAEAALRTIGEALKAAARVATARRDAAAARRDLEGEAAAARAAEATLAQAADQRLALASEIRDLEARLLAARFDPARHQALLEARPRAQQLVELRPRRERLARARKEQADALAKAEAGAAQAEATLRDLEERHTRAESALTQARAQREELHRRHAAAQLRRTLAPGEPCPVCAQTVGMVPETAVPDLSRAEVRLAEAEAAETKVRRALDDGRVRVERARGERQRASEQGDELRAQEKDVDGQARAVAEALDAAGFKPLERADPEAFLRSLGNEIAALERARTEGERVQAERRKQEAAAAQLEATAAAAQARLEAARGRRTEIEARLTEAEAALGTAREDLVARAQAGGWDLPPENPARDGGEDEAAALERQRLRLQNGHAETVAEAARLETSAERLEQDIARAAELGQKRADLEARAALAHSLSQHLRADQLLAYVQEEALRLLAADGSRHLEALSLGRYSLVAEDQEFAVVDHWNADRRRSVKTLSGGETFLASLALALALAEGLVELAAEDRAHDALESLFLDEGFGTLDPETLAQVVQALDALHGGRRLVGVVTHIPELAAQLPARVEVRREEGTARLRVS